MGWGLWAGFTIDAGLDWGFWAQLDRDGWERGGACK